MILRHWLAGIRLYIAVATVVIAAEVWWWATVAYGGGTVTVIRAEEAYAWLALVALIVAVLIGPALKVFPGLPGKAMLRDARRMIGIAAAVFASLHAAISYIRLFQAAIRCIWRQYTNSRSHLAYGVCSYCWPWLSRRSIGRSKVWVSGGSDCTVWCMSHYSFLSCMRAWSDRMPHLLWPYGVSLWYRGCY